MYRLLLCLSCEDEASQLVGEIRACERINGFGAARRARPHGRIKAAGQGGLVAGFEKVGMWLQPLGCGQLMIVPVFTISGLAWHDADLLTLRQGSQDCAHSGMRDDEAGLAENVGVFRWCKPHPSPKISRYVGRVRRWQDLPKDVAGRLDRIRPFIHCPHEPVEGKLRSGGQKDHKTAPMKCGPSGRAKCSHWVSHKSAYLWASLPDLDRSSALATLSIQMVRAPKSLPNRSAK